MNRKLVIAAAIVLVAAGAFFMTRGGNETAETTAANAPSAPREELIFANFRDIRDLNPHLYAGEMYAQTILYDTLVRVTDKNESGIEPCLAESWEISPDGKVYTFHIRKGVTFTDGNPCDAHAIKANFDAILENRTRHTWLEMMHHLVSVEAVDDYTFRITMDSPYYPMLIELGGTRPFAMISPAAMKDGSTKNGVNQFIGCGPYKLTEFVTDEYAIFEANENYWKGAPKIKKITVKVIPDNQTRILALEKGEIDLIYGKDMLDTESMKAHMGDENYKTGLSGPISTRQLLMNTTRDILSDVNVRKALQHATDKRAISEGVFGGIEKPADTLYSPHIPYCNVGLTPYEYDMEKAAKILDDGGWKMGADGVRVKDGKPLAFSLLYCSDRVAEKSIAEYLQGEYAKLGVRMSIVGQEEQSHRDNMKAGNFDVVFNITWGTPQDPQSSMAAMRAPVYGDFEAQQGLHDKAEIDAAITEILLSTDEERRRELYKFVLTRLHEDAVYIPLTYECNKALYTKDLAGVEFSANPFRIPFELMYFE